MKTQPDKKNKLGEWTQRGYVGKKYVWTVSGVLWNNIKERCNPNGATQMREPTYRGSENKFQGYQEFVEWNRSQKGYALGYQLDADILLSGNKIYSPETCILIPAPLNKFLQSCGAKRGEYPQGSYEWKGKLWVRICDTVLAKLEVTRENIEIGRNLYKAAKEARAREWAVRLQTEDFDVDTRVIDYLNKYEHICDWRGNDRFSL